MAHRTRAPDRRDTDAGTRTENGNTNGSGVCQGALEPLSCNSWAWAIQERGLPRSSDVMPWVMLTSVFRVTSKRFAMPLSRLITIWIAAACLALAQGPQPPQAGPVEILPLDQVEVGMRATAWTTFTGVTAEPIPIEILGVLRNAFGPRQDVILAKLGGKAQRTNVAGGMSGSPVYYDGKLLGAISLRYSQFSPDAIAGITPIELMLEITEFDKSTPLAAAAPVVDLAQAIWSLRDASAPGIDGEARPIATPLSFSGAYPGVLDVFSGYFRSRGYAVMQGGALASRSLSVVDPTGHLNPGEPISVVMMAGDMSATGLGTVTYNDGEKILAFGHSMFNSGRLEAPIATASIVHILASQLSPVKMANTDFIVGALRQDRHSGILGVLGESADMVPLRVNVRTFGDGDEVISTKHLNYDVIQNEKLTPQLVTMAVFNSMFGLNEFAQGSTFRLNAKVNFEGDHEFAFHTMLSDASGSPAPVPLLVASALGNRLLRLYGNTLEMPLMETIVVDIDLLPKRRTMVIDQVWIDQRRARPGDQINGKVVLQPYRGRRVEKEFQIEIPVGTPKGRLTLVVGDSSAYNRRQLALGARNRTLSLPESVSLLNQERRNDVLYIALMDRSPSASIDDTRMPNVPATTLNVMRSTAQGRMTLQRGSALAEAEIQLDAIVQGQRSLTIEIR